MSRRDPGKATAQRCRSGWTVPAVLLLVPVLAVPAALFHVGLDAVRRAAGSDPVSTASGSITMALGVAIAVTAVAVVWGFGRVELTFTAQGMVWRGRGTRLAATWSELRDPGLEVPFADSRGGSARLSLRKWGAFRRLTLWKDDRRVDVLEVFFPHFDQLLSLLENQRVRMHYW